MMKINKYGNIIWGSITLEIRLNIYFTGKVSFHQNVIHWRILSSNTNIQRLELRCAAQSHHLRCRHLCVPALILADPLVIQLPASGLGKQGRMVLALGPLHLCGRCRKSSWLYPTPATAAMWGMHQQIGDLCVSLSLSNSDFQINK